MENVDLMARTRGRGRGHELKNQFQDLSGFQHGTSCQNYFNPFVLPTSTPSPQPLVLVPTIKALSEEELRLGTEEQLKKKQIIMYNNALRRQNEAQKVAKRMSYFDGTLAKAKQPQENVVPSTSTASCQDNNNNSLAQETKNSSEVYMQPDLAFAEIRGEILTSTGKWTFKAPLMFHKSS